MSFASEKHRVVSLLDCPLQLGISKWGIGPNGEKNSTGFSSGSRRSIQRIRNTFPPLRSGLLRILTHINPLLTYACDLLHYLLETRIIAGPLLRSNWLIIFSVCLLPPAFFNFFPRVTLSEEEGGVRGSISNFGPRLPHPPPQMKHFYNHPRDQHMYQ